MSRVMPGKADCTTIQNNGIKEKHQNRLMLHSVNDTYQHFKEDHPEVKIGLTKFRQAKPKCLKAPES